MLALYLRFVDWLRSDKGQDLIEYALLLGLIAIICILAITFAGEQISRVWNAISDALANVI